MALALIPRLWRLLAGAQRSLDHQALSLEQLRAQAQADAVTGLLQRRFFVAQLQAALRTETPRGAGLLLVRVWQLQAMNQRLGRDATDRLLAALAQVLQSYPRRVAGALAGRLNGSDFALYLPAPGLAAETAQSLAQALRAALARVDPRAGLAIGAAELPPGCDASGALARCDGALARSECAGRFAVTLAEPVPADMQVPGEREWHARLSAALRHGRLRLAEQPVLDAGGTLLQLHCQLELQGVDGGAFEPEAHWRPMALRCALTAALDAAAIGLALAAIARDGRPRSVHLVAASLAGDGFAEQVTRLLRDAVPGAAARLRIELPEVATLQRERLQRAGTAWRALGVRLGVVCSGARLRRLSRLPSLGVDYVRVDGALLHGAATQPAVRELAGGLVALLGGMRLPLIAHAVADAADLQAVCALGLAGASAAARD
jgi:diguanylate cyclase (GGDEF)-like protein